METVRKTKQTAAGLEARLRAVHAMLKLRQRSPEAEAAMKEFAKAELEAYEAAVRALMMKRCAAFDFKGFGQSRNG